MIPLDLGRLVFHCSSRVNGASLTEDNTEDDHQLDGESVHSGPRK